MRFCCIDWPSLLQAVAQEYLPKAAFAQPLISHINGRSANLHLEGQIGEMACFPPLRNIRAICWIVLMWSATNTAATQCEVPQLILATCLRYWAKIDSQESPTRNMPSRLA